MSSIYIQEPPTSGKVLLKTTVGDVEIELWSRECPKACRNFVQLCMENYYNGTIFHRVVKGFIIQGGDPCGDGTGGESIYGGTFKDEFHSRLRFSRRGLVAMANSGKNDNASQFFFTLGPTPELQNKHTIFGKITGDTIFNVLKMEEAIVDHNEKPLYPQKILKTIILSNPFTDIVPRIKSDINENKKEQKKTKEKGVKNFGLLSFGEEAEEDEEKTNHFVRKNAGKAKSTHDVLNDPKLSKETLRIEQQLNNSDIEEYDGSKETTDTDIKEKTERIKNKLKSSLTKNEKSKPENEKDDDGNSSSDNEYYLSTSEQEKKIKRQKKAEEIRQEILSLKKQYKEERKVKDEMNKKQNEKEKSLKVKNELIKEYIDKQEKYSHLKEKIPKKGVSREEFTLSLLSKFKNKLESVREKTASDFKDDGVHNDIEKEIQTDDWLSHKLTFEEEIPILAKDASTKSDDWYDVYDPRNPINKRKRGESHKSSSKDRNKRSKV